MKDRKKQSSEVNGRKLWGKYGYRMAMLSPGNRVRAEFSGDRCACKILCDPDISKYPKDH